MRTCTRRLEFDAGHRVLRHESKCRHPHGHRYVVEVTCGAPELDDRGRVVDFGVIRGVFGAWLDENLDHGYVANPADEIGRYIEQHQDGKVYWITDGNPTAEVMVKHLASVADTLLRPHGVSVVAMRLYETPNCWADWRFGEGDPDGVPGRPDRG